MSHYARSWLRVFPSNIAEGITRSDGLLIRSFTCLQKQKNEWCQIIIEFPESADTRFIVPKPD